MAKPKNVHGTGLLLGETGVLLRGPSGAGKSVLALTLLDRWEGRRQPAFLVSDDRVDIVQTGRHISMQAPQSLAGLIELRGRGIITRPHKNLVTVHLIVDLVPDMARMLEEDALIADLAGVSVARAPVPYGSVINLGHQVLLVVEAIAALRRS